MTFPAVPTTNSGNSGGNVTSQVISMPSGVAAGDLVIVVFACDGNPTLSISSGTGWNNLYDTVGPASACKGAAWYKVATGSGDNLTIGLSASEGCAWTSLRITGQHASTPPAVATAATGTSNAPDAPNLNPANWDVEDTLWIWCHANDNGGLGALGYPSNYNDNQLTSQWVNTNGARVASATRNLAAASDDPGVASMTASEQWVCNTIAVRPAGPMVADTPVVAVDFAAPAPATARTSAVGTGLLDFTGPALVDGQIANVPAAVIDFFAPSLAPRKSAATPIGLAQLLGIVPASRFGAAVPFGTIELAPLAPAISKSSSLAPAAIDALAVAPATSKNAAVSSGVVDLPAVTPIIRKTAGQAAASLEFSGVDFTFGQQAAVSAGPLKFTPTIPATSKACPLAMATVLLSGVVAAALRAASLPVSALELVGLAGDEPLRLPEFHYPLLGAGEQVVELRRGNVATALVATGSCVPLRRGDMAAPLLAVLGAAAELKGE